MNTNPDEAKLALWLEDELHGEEQATFDAWASQQPEHVAAREEIRHWKQLLARTLPVSEEPPFPDFFNSKILQAIREETPAAAPVEQKTPVWQALKTWLMPATAFAGMAFAFWAGVKTQSRPAAVAATPVAKAELQPTVYTPDGVVNAVWTNSAGASVIVLEGVNPIPDATDFSETAFIDFPRESDATAEQDTQPKHY